MSVMQKSVRRGNLFKETLTGKRLNTHRTYIYVRAQGHSYGGGEWCCHPAQQWRQSGRKKYNTHMRVCVCVYIMSDNRN
jgi:hypothetical protein